jgi:twitching motility protein PilT
LREDPDVVLVGEMRDLETMEAAMKLAETGHLTMATLHTNSAAQTITRIVDAFPAHQQAQIRTQLSLVLEGVVCQALLPKASGQGRVAALEILIATPAIRNLIRDDKIHQIYVTMQAGQEKYGMQTMNQSLARLVERRVVSRDTAFTTSSNRDELIMMLERGAPQAVPSAALAAAGARRPVQGVGR